MNKSDLTEKLKDAMDRKCHVEQPRLGDSPYPEGCRKYLSFNIRWRIYGGCVNTVCIICSKNRDLAQELAGIAEEHYKAERTVEV